MIIKTKSELQKLSVLCRNSLYLSYDLETTGLRPQQHDIIGIAVASDNFEAYIVLKSWQDGKLIDVLSYDDVTPFLKSIKVKRLLMHNASFDIRFTKFRTGVDFSNNLHADTMLLAHTLDENLYSYGLKELGTKYFGESAVSEKTAMLDSIKVNGGTAKEFYKADTQLMAEYAMKDVRMTYDLWKLLDPQLDKEGLRKFFYEVEVMPLLKTVTINMEYRGIPVDVELLQRSQTEIATDIAELEKRIQTAIKPLLTDFETWFINTKYPVKYTGPFKDKLAEILAPPEWPRTESGGYSFNKTAYERAIKKGGLAPDTELARYVFGEQRVPTELATRIQLELVRAECGEYPFNLQSKDHLKRLFFGTTTTPSVLNETPLSKTDKGAPQVDDEFLDKMAQKYEWCKWLRTYNKLNKIKSTYIDAMLENQVNGIFYPQFFQHRTVSGRYGSNIQQLPRPIEDSAVQRGDVEAVVQKYTNRIRNFLIAGPGRKLIGTDYESLEPKVFSHVSGDENLINIFRRGDDFYSTIAIDTEKLSEYSANKEAPNYLGKLNKPKRQTAKSYSLGIPYGLTGYKLQFELNIPLEEAEKLVKNYLQAYPALDKWMKDSMAFAIKNGYIKSISGRIRHMPELTDIIRKFSVNILDSLWIYKEFSDNPKYYEYVKRLRRIATNYINNARNFQIQSLAAHIVNMAAIEQSKVFNANPEWDAYTVLQIHDELVVSCKAEFVDKVATVVQNKMENTTKLSLPLVAVPAVADRYGDTK